MSFQMTARFQPPEGVANMKLSKVIGITSLTNSCVAEAESSDLIAYAAGCIAVLYNPNTNRQVSYFKVTRTISSLALTHDGIYLAIGERGHQPCITIWDTQTSEKISTLTGHQHGVGIMKFSLDDEILVSVGFKTDKQLLVWNWKEGKQTCSMKLENKVNSINFHMGGQFFVTCGDNHLKWWYMIKETHPTDSDKQIVKGLNGRPASILDVHRNSNFVDILCAKVNMNQSIHTNVYTLSSTGVLCLLHESRLMDKWVQVDTPTAYALALTPTSHVLVGCTNGRILVFSGVSLEYLASLPTPSPLPSSSTQSQIKYPACYSICSLSSSSHVISVYADRSMFIWDLTDIHQPIKLRSFTNHSSCIWDLQFLPTHPTTSPASHPTMALPSGTFFTCGADNMIHIWNLDPKQQRSSPWKSTSSRDLLHSLAVDIVETDVLKRKSLDADSLEFDLSSSFPDFELPDRQQGLQTARCLALHPNGTELACGSKIGTVHIFNLQTMKPLLDLPNGIKAHEAEILTLSYSPPIHDQTEQDTQTCFLASGGRDRLIHIYDATPTLPDDQRYHLVTTLDSHSSSITITHFTSDGHKFISCSGDKTMVLSTINGNEFHRVKSIPTPHGTINGFALDSATSKFAVSTGQDKRINVWNIQSGKLVRSYKPEGLNSEFYKCSVDPSGMFVATCSFDKQIRIYDFFSGELIHQDFGHSELITSVKFSPDGRNLISVGGDGCIMVWEIAEHLVEAMQDRLVELYAVAERKKQVADERIHQSTDIASSSPPSTAASESNPNKQKHPIRTGGGLPSEGVVGKSVSSSKRPATSAASSSEKSTPSRPSTAGSQQKQQQQQKPVRRLPAWAARGLKSSTPSSLTESTSSISSSSPSGNGNLVTPPQSKWAERVQNQDLQILGKPLVNKEKHKLTLELTTGDATWNALPPPPPLPAPQGIHTADKLASTLEESDDVLFMDDPNPQSRHGHGHGAIDTSDEEDEEMPEVDGEDEDEETDRLNQTSSNLNLLEESVEQLESWLEKKLREESQVDASSLAIDERKMEGNSAVDANSKAILGSSLSSDFFKKVRENPDTMVTSVPSLLLLLSSTDLSQSLPPPPEYSPKVESSISSINSKEMLFNKQQETAAAVSQMRNRLKAMGILEKTVAMAEKDTANSQSTPPEFLPPPPPLPSATGAAVVSVSRQEKPLPVPHHPPSTAADVVAVDNDDDTVSTVSGGSALEEETVLDNDDLDPLEESSYRELLSDLATASQKALTAYEELLKRKKQTLETKQFSSTETKSINPSEERIPLSNSDQQQQQHLLPSYSAMSPRVNRGTREGAMGAQSSRMPTIDKLLLEFETNFGNIFNTAENLLSTSGLHQHHNHASAASESMYQSSLIGARQSKIEYDPSHSHLEMHMHSRGASRDDDKLLFESLRQSGALSGARAGAGLGNSDSDATAAATTDDVSLFLERYSDRLVTMVAEKMLASSSSQK